VSVEDTIKDFTVVFILTVFHDMFIDITLLIDFVNKESVLLQNFYKVSE
jgi:hypothetical protein